MRPPYPTIASCPFISPFCECEEPAARHLAAYIPDLASSLRDPQAHLDHKAVLNRIHHHVHLGLVQQHDRVGQARLTAYAAPFADFSWNQDTLLSNVAFRDSPSMRLGVSVFDDSMACSFCQQPLDTYGHYCMNCMGQGHKQVMHTSFRNVVYRLAARAGARPALETPHLLPDQPRARPADVLIVTLPDVHQSSWRRFPKLALDCAITSPFQSSVLRPSATTPLAAADRYTDLKRQHTDMQQRCARQNLGFEPLVLESTGGFCGETATLLQSLAKVVDTREHLPPGHTWQRLQESLSIDLQRGLHGACLKQRQQWSRSTLSLTEVGAAFMATCV